MVEYFKINFSFAGGNGNDCQVCEDVVAPVCGRKMAFLSCRRPVRM